MKGSGRCDTRSVMGLELKDNNSLQISKISLKFSPSRQSFSKDGLIEYRKELNENYWTMHLSMLALQKEYFKNIDLFSLYGSGFKLYSTREEAYNDLLKACVSQGIQPPTKEIEIQNIYQCKESPYFSIIKISNQEWCFKDSLKINAKYNESKSFNDYFEDTKFNTFKEAKEALKFFLDQHPSLVK